MQQDPCLRDKMKTNVCTRKMQQAWKLFTQMGTLAGGPIGSTTISVRSSLLEPLISTPTGDVNSLLDISGSHTRAVDLFTWSIKNPKKFITNEVLDHAPEYEKPVKKTCIVKYTEAQMGYFADKHAQKGLFYVKTNDRDPWQ